jgi:hypothetical protein
MLAAMSIEGVGLMPAVSLPVAIPAPLLGLSWITSNVWPIVDGTYLWIQMQKKIYAKA